MNIIKLYNGSTGETVKSAEMKNKELNRRLIELNLLLDGSNDREISKMNENNLLESLFKKK